MKATLVTSSGDIVIELFEAEAPNTVANFLAYVKVVSKLMPGVLHLLRRAAARERRDSFGHCSALRERRQINRSLLVPGVQPFARLPESRRELLIEVRTQEALQVLDRGCRDDQ